MLVSILAQRTGRFSNRQLATNYRASWLNYATISATPDEFTKRQDVWAGATGPLLNLIDDRSQVFNLTKDPMDFKKRDLESYFAGFSKWIEQIGRYAGAIDAQAILSDGSDQNKIEEFLKKMAQAAIGENLINTEDCERIGISLQE